MPKISNMTNDLITSLVARTGPAGSVDDILDWVQKRNAAVRVQVDLISFDKMKMWHIDSGTGNLVHDSGKFFSICGVRIKSENTPLRKTWDQPIIDQPEVGFLGIITKKVNGVLCFLLQAKIEPGNVNNVQLSPTLQATRSNYMRIHQGKTPRYLEYFYNFRKYPVLVDQLQSEQGGRFLYKRNRNIIIEVNEPVADHPDFVWVTLGQIKELMQHDNIVNMDTRTVISGLSLSTATPCTIDHFFSLYKRLPLSNTGSSFFESEMLLTGCCTIDDILSWLTELKSRYFLQTVPIPLREVAEWQTTDSEIVRHDRSFFRVIGAQITIENREVATWCQPLVQPMQEGICALIAKKIDSVLHFLIQAKVECGNLDIVELAPSIQALTGNLQQSGVSAPPFLDYIQNASDAQILFDVKQSEEGGRFFREQNRNMLVLADDSFPEELPENYCWMTLGQLKEFLRYNNYLNIQLRSLVAIIDLIAV